MPTARMPCTNRPFISTSLVAFCCLLASCNAAPWEAPAPAATASPAAAPADPLASWNDGPAKKAIVDFVVRTTTPNRADFVATAERIAVFDNDGTLWSSDSSRAGWTKAPSAAGSSST